MQIKNAKWRQKLLLGEKICYRLCLGLVLLELMVFTFVSTSTQCDFAFIDCNECNATGFFFILRGQEKLSSEEDIFHNLIVENINCEMKNSFNNTFSTIWKELSSKIFWYDIINTHKALWIKRFFLLHQPAKVKYEIEYKIWRVNRMVLIRGWSEKYPSTKDNTKFLEKCIYFSK